MMSSQVHLENFVESTAALPAELVRLLATIKDLDERSHSAFAQFLSIASEQSAMRSVVMHDDELPPQISRCAELSERIEDNVAECLARPPQASAANRKGSSDAANEVGLCASHAGMPELLLHVAIRKPSAEPPGQLTCQETFVDLFNAVGPWLRGKADELTPLTLRPPADRWRSCGL